MISGRAGVVTRPPRKAGARRPGTGPTRGARRDARDDAGRKREGWRTWQAGSEEGSAPSRLNLDGSRALRAFHRRWPTSVAAEPHALGCVQAHPAVAASRVALLRGCYRPLSSPTPRRSDLQGCCAVVVPGPCPRTRKCQERRNSSHWPERRGPSPLGAGPPAVRFRLSEAVATLQSTRRRAAATIRSDRLAPLTLPQGSRSCTASDVGTDGKPFRAGHGLEKRASL